MSKNILKLSTLFCAIFIFLLFLFLQTNVLAQVSPPIYTYSCFCYDKNPTPGQANFQPFNNIKRTEADPVVGCTNYCQGFQKLEYIGYQKPGENFVIKKGYEKIFEQSLPEGTDQLPESSTINCPCSDGNYYPIEGGEPECTVYCEGLGLEKTSPGEVPVAIDEQLITSTQPAASAGDVCKCKNGITSSSHTDKPSCDTFCLDKGGVEIYPSPPPESQETTKTTISNPLKGIETPADLIKSIVNYVLGFVGALAVLIIIYSGFIYMTSRGNEKQIESAKNTLTYAIIGLVVIFASLIIVNAILSAIGAGGG